MLCCLGVWALELCLSLNPNSLLSNSPVYWANSVKISELQFPQLKSASAWKVVGRMRQDSTVKSEMQSPLPKVCSICVRDLIKAGCFKIWAIWRAHRTRETGTILKTKGTVVEKRTIGSLILVTLEWCTQQWFSKLDTLLPWCLV